MENKLNDEIQKIRDLGSAGSQKKTVFESYLVASENDEWVAYPVKSLTETYQISDAGELIRIPLVENHILGVVNVRGEMVPVVSFMRICGYETNFPNFVIIVEDTFKIGIAADRIVEIAEVDTEKISNLSEIEERPQDRFVKREFDFQGKIVRIIDIPRFFDSPFLK